MGVSGTRPLARIFDAWATCDDDREGEDRSPEGASMLRTPL